MLTKKIFTLCIISFLLLSCDRQKAESEIPEVLADGEITAASLITDGGGLSFSKAILKTVHGNIEFKFYPQKAPNTVTRIIQLIRTGFYDGLIFHRVIGGFVAQTGDPTATGSGGSGTQLKAEFNNIQHIKGTVAMARGPSDDSADSQFYIAFSALPQLDGKYTVFGQVSEGFQYLMKIKKGDKILSLSFVDLKE